MSMVMSCTVPVEIVGCFVGVSLSTAKPAMAVPTVPNVVAILSHARKVRSFAKYVLGSILRGIFLGNW